MAVIFDLAIIASDGKADAQTVSIPTAKVARVRAATAGEIAKFPTAVTVVEVDEIRGKSAWKGIYISVTALATVKTAINA
jgi:hypothetical protein